MGEYEEIPVEHQFIRIHKWYLVNRKYIVKIDKDGMLWMKDGKPLPVSGRRKEAAMNLLKNNHLSYSYQFNE